MKVAIVTPMLQPYRITFYEKLSKHDPNYRWRVFHGVSSKESGRPSFKGEVPFEEVGLREYIFHVGPFKLVFNRGLLREIKRFDPDLVILQGIAGDLTNRMVVNWAHRKKRKIILWTCGWEPGVARGRALKFKNSLVSTFFRKANLHLTYSTKASHYTEGMGVAPENIEVAYNGIETDPMVAAEKEIRAKAAEIRSEFGLEGYTTFIYVGGLIPVKRVDLLLDAFAELRQKHEKIKLMIIGDGPLRGELEDRMAAMKDENIRYLGRIIDGVDPYFAASDCLVLPGVGGLALNQAMFWGVPCIVSEADGTEDDLVIEGESGYRFEKDDMPSLRDAMERHILTGEEDLVKVAAKARELIVEKSNVNNMVDIFMKSVKKLMPLK